ncbi:acetyl-CoA synthetase [Kurthia zopfii]|uniref:Acetyltransferase n=1 Tax=Kurthia zopfii TaxID=1650 RepID=A0A8B4QAC6_9BACL|nr:acetate--CoA ligase family protein [Kurthia zopfii]PWI21714.1 CoA-binding protein [Kurthia zopfii]TDR35776.1 acetyltransferase [Kurthia zopfii]GEK31155.1 acetyl-CoA synthetase [Kurthia zopfii]STX09680.1 succinyl-CoA synthetase subunit alpha [Kurthia zopfii]
MLENSNFKALEPLFKPRGIAVLGASESKYKIGYLQVQALLDGKFTGEIYPIHRSAEEIAGLKCYPTVEAIEGDVDLAIMCTGAEQIESGIIDCAKGGVKAIIIFAAGFSETGEEGDRQQKHLANLAKQYGIRIVGPNCVGLVNTSNGLIGTFSPAILSVPSDGKKGVGYVSQSGAFGVLTYMAAAQNGVLFNYFVSTGNEMESEFSDFVEYMIHDDDTQIISGYMEGAKNPKKLLELSREALKRKKPIILMKTGRSTAGSRAASSHTGSLAGADNIYDAFFRQTSIVRADDYDDIISFSKLFNPDRLPKGKNTVIVTSSGGRGINEADRCEAHGLNVIQLSDDTKSKIMESIPSFASATNPIDLTAAASVTNPELFIAPLKALLADPEVHNIIYTEFPFSWTAETPEVQEMIKLVNESDKFVCLTTFELEGMKYPPATPALVENGIPVLTGTLNPIRALSKLVNYSLAYDKQFEEEIQTEAFLTQDITEIFADQELLSEAQSGAILQAYGIPTTNRIIAMDVEAAKSIAEQVGYPVVMKVDSADIPHKTEADAIRLNLQSEEEVINAFNEIMHNAKQYNPTAVINGVSVQEMLEEGVEIIIGAQNDEVFGPVVMVGLGGIFVEVFKDVAFSVAPLSRRDALEMLEELKAKAVLDGARGRMKVDTEAIVDILLRVSELMMDQKDHIQELDINPVIVYEKGAKAADAMIALKSVAEKAKVGDLSDVQ